MTQQLDPSRRTRMAVVGLGYWGPNLVRNVNELANAELAMVCDSRRSSLEKIAQRYPAVATTDDYQDRKSVV